MAIFLQAMGYGQTHFGELWRFGVVGVLTFGINFLSFSLLYGVLGADYRVAASLAYVVTVCCHFLLNKTFTFGAKTQRVRHCAPRYGLMLGINYVITILASMLTVEVFGASPYLGVVASTAGTAASSFLIMKYFVFRSPALA